MQKKLAAILFSTRLTAVLFLVFAAAMAAGTWLDRFAETSPTPYTRTLIYNAWWFEAIMGIFVINFLGNIFRFRLYKKEKWTTLSLHLAFILILMGAFITRYIGYEGVIRIREGATENRMLSDQTYLTAFIDGDYVVDGVPQRRKVAPKKLLLSERLDNDFTITTDYNQQPVTITYKDFIKNAKEGLIPSEEGEEYLKIVEAGDGSRHDHWIKLGQITNIHNILFAVNLPTEGAINIGYHPDGSYTIDAPFEGSFMRMADQMQGIVVKDSTQPLQLRSLYQLGGMSFVVPEPVTKGSYGIVQAPKTEPTNQDALIVDVATGTETKTVELLGGKGNLPDPVKTEIGGMFVYLTYGSKQYDLPFSITLNDFIADKYPGTENSYSAFKSKITVNDSETDFFDYDIYMNHVLDHKGYRFFQASFDPDEKGTVLSINKDAWGTWITYIGYLLLYFGLMAILFDRNSRFGALKRMLDKVKSKKSKLLTMFLILFSFSGFAQNNINPKHTKATKTQIDSVLLANAVSKDHAAKFAHLIIQDNGRMKPINTFASELLRKVSKKDSYEGLDANQVFISMTEFPALWSQVPIIALKRGNDSIRHVVGAAEDVSQISLLDLFDENANYKLQPYLEAATKKTNPNQFEKDFIKAHENFYVLNQALSGSILKIFPLPNSENNKWVSYPELNEANFKGMDSTVTRTILPIYFQTLREARKTGDYTEAEEILAGITKFQKKYGEEVMPSENKIKAEIIYNRVDLFNRLYKYFVTLGALMFLFIIIQIFTQAKVVNSIVKVFKYIIWALFALMTIGLAMRWYISGHAPWSDAYESVVYVAWATVFFGLAFGRKSDLTVASTAFVASIILWAAHLNWLDPAIANLQPVLDSYWLMIHVAVIVASYGPFTLGMILAATTLLLMLLTTKNNHKRMDLNIKELTIITEMSLTVGLVMLTIGNFLGGMWANESWGRYWGWDPKETWALISIMIYAFVIHMRLVPGLRGRWQFNVAAMFAYASIMMTYFGVNFYLSGLHSYASGDAPATPTFVYYIVSFAVLLSIAAYFSYKKYYIKKG
ncbi:cytochrome c-type biogenesis protein CcsB [Ulvibacter sp. MAR_2010_11]|uniref:cytochrome c biogenesis protein CcsA n=1 Tax=Ulvibacter sp. MAR_2010_11 TaxID=1250229 RepID=UPI000C2C8330|nr:cytochrome c biogenesis protein CcsA [Ulvibacter sp. MAR_2010_11]PKA84006.1 cytochrome c-type biogenesis protein CcsB [Ulvibacter sp. MAR_2010_11]